MRRESTYQEGSSIDKLLMGKEITSPSDYSVNQAPELQTKANPGDSSTLTNT